MSSLMDRERDFENRFVHDQELRFRIEARRSKLAGRWAAEKLGLTGEAAEAYAQDLIRASFMRAGDTDVFAKLRADFDAAGVQQSDHQIHRTLEETLAEAERQIMRE